MREDVSARLAGGLPHDRPVQRRLHPCQHDVPPRAPDMCQNRQIEFPTDHGRRRQQLECLGRQLRQPMGDDLADTQGIPSSSPPRILVTHRPSRQSSTSESIRWRMISSVKYGLPSDSRQTASASVELVFVAQAVVAALLRASTLTC